MPDNQTVLIVTIAVFSIIAFVVTILGLVRCNYTAMKCGATALAASLVLTFCSQVILPIAQDFAAQVEVECAEEKKILEEKKEIYAIYLDGQVVDKETVDFSFYEVKVDDEKHLLTVFQLTECHVSDRP